MKNFIQFFKTTALGGLIVIIPIAILAFMVGDMVDTLITTTQPLSEGLPFDPMINTLIAVLIVIVSLVMICFIAGYLLSTLLGSTIRNWLEKNLLEHIPMYSTLRGLTQQFAGIEGANYPVVEADMYNSENRVLGVLVGNLPDGRLITYVPLSPIVTVGQLHILPKQRVTITDLSMVETLSCISQMRLEAESLYKKSV